MLQQNIPDDYVLSTGFSTTVREFVEKAFLKADIHITWEGCGYNEIGKDNDGKILIKIDKNLFRPCEVNTLCGDCTKAKNILNWEIEYDLDKLIDDMFEN
jgi:GDPmannose 4,6-dehydratase